jgi:transcriptional regulator of arginine metabolism
MFGGGLIAAQQEADNASVPTKPQRHAAILRLIRSERIPSQERLRELLAGEGIAVAQATLSRDLRSLGIVKAADAQGHGHYVVAIDAPDPTPALSQLLPALFVGLEGVEYLLVLKTLTGGAQPVAAAIDHQNWQEVVGTIAGDDTILIITRSVDASAILRKRLLTAAHAE